MSVNNHYSYIFCFILLLAFCCGAFASEDSIELENNSERLTPVYSWEFNPLMQHVSHIGWGRLRDLYAEIQDKGCDTNLFFLLEGTNEITNQNFKDQVNFADLIMAITTTDSGGNFGAAVYNEKVKLISVLTKNPLTFLDRLRAAQRPSGRIADLYNALKPTTRMLSHLRGDANKIVLFSKKKPIVSKVPSITKEFFGRGGSICAISLSGKNKQLLTTVTRDANKVLMLDNFFDLGEIIYATVRDVCHM